MKTKRKYYLFEELNYKEFDFLKHLLRNTPKGNTIIIMKLPAVLRV